MKSTLDHFKEQVSLKYSVYNSIFQTLGLDGINQTGIILPVFSNFCHDRLETGEDPVSIVDKFFKEQFPHFSTDNKQNTLFSFIKFIERQVVLVDALEDASFDKINDISGSGSLKSFYETVENRNRIDAFKRALEYFKVRIVLTAHPTQFYPGQVLGIIKDLAEAIENNQISEIKTRLTQLGYTPFFKKEKPSPYDEAVNLIWFLENLFYHSIPSIYEEMGDLLDLNFTEVIQLASAFQLGFWPGGDRDGNPFVNSEITLKVAHRLRSSILKCYYRDVRLLKRKLTFRNVEPILFEMEQKLYRSGFLEEYIEGFGQQDLLEMVELVQNLLVSEHNSLFLKEVVNLKLKVQSFGFYFATLDIRQDNDIIKQTFDKVRTLNSSAFQLFDRHNIAEYFSFKGSINHLDIEDPVIKDTLNTFGVVKDIQNKNGIHGSYRYIISNCNSARSVARVFILSRLLAFDTDIPMDIIPLFETINDLEKAGHVMRELYENSDYREHLRQRSDKQVVMLGFSDGTKDGGYVTANWSIFKAKEEVSKISREYGVKSVFFDGRGGPPARGGGNTHKFYSSLGKSVESEEIQLTIQGQTISSNFGTRASSKFNLEQLFTAGLENLVFDDEGKTFSREQRELMEEISRSSLKYYEAFKEDPKFIGYLENRSTLKFYNKANIGSRPAKRGKDTKLTLKDLRAIPFVGAWSQLKQNVPGFYGLGSAFRELDKQGKLEDLKSLYKSSLFFRTLLDNSMQSLCKTYFPLTQYMADDPEYGEFWRGIYREYQLSVEYLLKISGQKELMENNPSIKESIKLREKIVLPLLVIQQYGLKKLLSMDGKESSREKTVLESLVVRSLYGNINASRNSA